LSQLFIEAVIQSRLNMKTKATKIRQLYNAHHLAVAFSYTIVQLNDKTGNKTI